MSTAIKNRSLILTLDAFGTLIKPRKPIIDQYKEEAGKFGVRFKQSVHLDALLSREFKAAFRALNREYPNYGGAGSIGYEKWWHLVVQRTLEPHATGPIPNELAPALLKRFSSTEGYELHSDVLPFLRSVSSKTPPWRYPPLVTIPSDSPTPPQDTPMTIFGILSNGDPRIPLILDAFGISKYFSFQLLSYHTGHTKPSREAFRLARQTGLMIGKGDPTYKIKDPISGEEMRKKWLGWDFVHVGDAIFEDWLAARKLPDFQPVWLHREQVGLYGEDLEKFGKRSQDKFPLQMLHMAEGMKGWGEKKMWATKRKKLMQSMGTNEKSLQCMHELLNSTITDLTELPSLFGEINPPPESADGSPLSIALTDPDKWEEGLQKWREEKTRVNLESQEVYAYVRDLRKQMRNPKRGKTTSSRNSNGTGRGSHSRGSTRRNEERSDVNVERHSRGSTWRNEVRSDANVERHSRGSTWRNEERSDANVERTQGSSVGVWREVRREEAQPEFKGLAYRRIKLSRRTYR